MTFQLMSAARTERTLTRIARQILEDTHGEGNIILFGIGKRGEKLSAILSSRLHDILGHSVPFYRLPRDNEEAPASIPDVDTSGSHTIIVDDVIFGGKTMYQAFVQVMKLGKPKHVKLAVLVDRGHRIYPIEAQYVGIVSPTKLNEHVSCTFDKDKPDGVWLSVEQSV
ncbi:MAG: phosphoribosyltransferase family protein [Balneolales bacterium]